MNPHCECPVPGFCNRHKILKSPREHSFCHGTADTEDCGSKYFFAWERGELGATAPDEPVLKQDWDCDQPGNVPIARSQQPSQATKNSISKIGDRLKAIIEHETGAVIPCSECKAHILQLNSMTPVEARKDRDGTVIQIASRAAGNAPQLWQKIAVFIDQTLNTGLTERRIGEWVDLAIAEEEEEKQQRKKKQR